jgi:hypothetical protein
LAFRLGREADHSPPSSAEVKEWVELYFHSPNAPAWCGAQLGGAQGGQTKGAWNDLFTNNKYYELKMNRIYQ